MLPQTLKSVDLSKPIRLVGINERNDVAVFHERFSSIDPDAATATFLDGPEINLLPSVLFIKQGLPGLYEVPQDVNDHISKEPFFPCALYLAHQYNTMIVIQSTPAGKNFISCIDEAAATLISMHVRNCINSGDRISPAAGTDESLQFAKSVRDLMARRLS